MSDQYPARRGLSPLDQRLPEATRTCAQHLRDLRDRTDFSSGELARRLSTGGLKVDETRLSKFLNGREIPRREFAAHIHQVVAEVESCDVSPDEVRRTRDLMYAAVRARSPLQAREFELADAREELERQREHAEQQLKALREEAAAERRNREAAERALAEFGSRTQAEMSELAEQRDAAERRVAELEEQMRQVDELIRLQSLDSRALSEMASATNAELLLRDLATVPDNVTDVYRALVDWRNHFQDEQADQLLEWFATSSSHTAFTPWDSPFRKLHKMLVEAQRTREAQRLINTLVRLRPPSDLFELTRYCFGGLFDMDHEEDDGMWVRSMLPTLAREASTWTLLYFHRQCIETDEGNLAWALRRYVLRIRPEPRDPDNPHEAELLQRAQMESDKAIPDLDPEWRTFSAEHWAYWTGLG